MPARAAASRRSASTASPPTSDERGRGVPLAQAGLRGASRSCDGVQSSTSTRSRDGSPPAPRGRAARPGAARARQWPQAELHDLPDRDVEGERRVDSHPQRARLRRRRPSRAGPAPGCITAPWRHHHPLGPARRARGVDHVGQVLRRRRRSAGRLGALSRASTPRSAPARVRVTTAAPGVLQRARPAARRDSAGIERHVGAAGLEDAQERPPPLHRALDSRGRPAPRAPRPAPAGAGPAVGAPVELAVGQAPSPADHGRGLGRPRGLRREQVVQAGAILEEPAPWRSTRPSTWCRSAAAQQRQLARRGAPARPRRRRAGASKWPRQPLTVVGVEEVGGRTRASAASARRASVEATASGRTWRCRRPPPAGASRRPGSSERLLAGAFWSTSITWNSGVWLEVALGRPAPRPASRTARPGARRRPARSRAPGRAARAKAGSPDEVAAQDQGVDEEADQPLDLRPVAAGDGRAHRAGRPGRCSARAGPGSRPAAP